MRADVVVVGSYNQDLVWEVEALPAPGETRRATRFASGPGGKGCNQAVAAARQDVPTALLAAVGIDSLADHLRRLASEEGIDLRLESIPDAATGSAAIWVDAGGRNSIVVALGANERLSIQHVATHADCLRSARVVLAPLECPLATVAAAFRIARAAGARTILNPAPVHPDLDLRLLALSELLTPNENEFAQLLERFTPHRIDARAVAGLDDGQLAALCRALPVETMVLTLGAAGVFAAAGATATSPFAPIRLPALPVEAIDSTGAGDAFNGSLAALWADRPGDGWQAALPRAVAVAGIACERRGAALSIPRAVEVDARLTRA